MPLRHERIERTQRLLDRRGGIEAVDLIEIDMIEPQPLQAGLRRLHDVEARGAAAVGALAGDTQELGRQHEFVALEAEVADRLAGDLLRAALGIDIGGVDEVDAGVDRGAQQAVGFRLTELADLAPHPLLSAEGHGAEAEFGNEQAGIAKPIETHGGCSGKEVSARGNARVRWYGPGALHVDVGNEMIGRRGLIPSLLRVLPPRPARRGSARR